MPFFKDLRWRKTDPKADKPPKASKNSDRSATTVSTTHSSSTVNSLRGSSTPSSSQPNTSNPNLLNGKSSNGILPSQRPVALSPSSNRHSVVVCDWCQNCWVWESSQFQNSRMFRIFPYPKFSQFRDFASKNSRIFRISHFRALAFLEPSKLQNPRIFRIPAFLESSSFLEFPNFFANPCV